MNTLTIIAAAAAGFVAVTYGLALISYLADIAERDYAALAHELAALDACQRHQ